MQLLDKPRRRPSINITSLIDVLFLLLTFFLVTTSFIEQSALKVELPSMQHSEQTEREKRFVLNVSTDGKMNYNGRETDAEALRRELGEAAEEINTSGGLVLRADRSLDYGDVVTVLDLIRGAGIKRFAIAAVAPGE